MIIRHAMELFTDTYYHIILPLFTKRLIIKDNKIHCRYRNAATMFSSCTDCALIKYSLDKTYMLNKNGLDKIIINKILNNDPELLV